MEALSMDLRERIVRACDQPGAIRRNIAKRFCVSVSFLGNLLRRRRDSGSIAPKPRSGGFASKLQEPHLQQIRAQVKQQPDATLAELCDRLHEQARLRVSGSSLCRALQTLKLPRKKSPCTPANATASG